MRGDIIEKNTEIIVKEYRAELVLECKTNIAKCEFMKELLIVEEDRNAITITIGKQSVALADGFSDIIVNALDRQIEEAQKCIDGKENGYE